MSTESTKKSIVLSAIDLVSPTTRKVEESQKKLNQQFENTKKSAAETSKILSKVNSYEKAQAATLKADAALKKHTKQYQALKSTMDKLKEPTADQVQKLADLEYKVSTATLAYKAKQQALDATSSAIRKAGFDTDKLAEAQGVLTRRAKAYRNELEKQRQALRENTKAEQSRQAAANFISSGVGGVGAGAGAGVMAASMAGINEERTLFRVESAAESKNIEGADQLKDIAREIAASRAGQGVAIQDIHQSMIMAISSGATSAEEVEKRVMTDLKVYATVDKNRMDFWEVSKQTARMSSLEGSNQKDTEAFAAAIARNYHGTDPDDAFDGYTEVRARTDAAGIDSKAVQAFHLAMLKNNMTGGESSSTLEAMAEWVTVGGKNASKAQNEAYAKVGLTAEQGAAMAQDDLIGYMELVYKRMENFESGEQVAITEQLFGSGFMTILKAMKSGDFRTMQTEVSNTDGLQEDLDKRFEKSVESASAGLDSAIGALGRVATELFDPIKEPFNQVMDTVAGGLNRFADYIDGANQNVVAASVGVAGLAGGALAVKKVIDVFSMLRPKATMKAQTVIVNGGIGKFDTPEGKSKGKGKAAGSLVKGGLLKGAGKLALRAVPLVGTAMLAYDAVSMLSEGLTGKGFIENIKGFFGGDDEKEKLSQSSDNKSVFTAEAVPQVDELIQKTTSEQTKSVSVNVSVSGKVEGLTPEGEQRLIDQTVAEIRDAVSPMHERESYG